jgi:hypothetical protein
VFTVEERDRVRERLLALAESDPDVAAAAITGSYAAGKSDEWSDVDLAFSIRGLVENALERWTPRLYDDFGALHHWDLPWGSSLYRVWLLGSGLEIDIAFTPAGDFGPRGPNWRTVFGETVEVPAGPAPDQRELVGQAWHHVLHARICIERDQPWQAEWLINRLRDYVLTLACLRLGLPARFAKGADLLPVEVSGPVEGTLVRSLDEAELRRALAAAAGALLAELERTDEDLAASLRPVLEESAT